MDYDQSNWCRTKHTKLYHTKEPHSKAVEPQSRNFAFPEHSWFYDLLYGKKKPQYFEPHQQEPYPAPDQFDEYHIQEREQEHLDYQVIEAEFFYKFILWNLPGCHRIAKFPCYDIPKREKLVYKMTIKYIKWPQNIQNGRKIDQIAI
jgi:hypothetical protein